MDVNVHLAVLIENAGTIKKVNINHCVKVKFYLFTVPYRYAYAESSSKFYT